MKARTDTSLSGSVSPQRGERFVNTHAAMRRRRISWIPLMVVGSGLLLAPGVEPARGEDGSFRDFLRNDREEFNRFQRGNGGNTVTSKNKDATIISRSVAAAADAEQTVEPLADDQRLDLTNGAALLIPGDTLVQAAVFHVRVVTNEAALLYGDDYRPLGGVEIDVQPTAAVKAPFTVVLPYAATGLNQRYSASEQLLVQQQRVTNGVWRPVPFTITPGQTGNWRTVEATVVSPGMLRCVSLAFERSPLEGGGKDGYGRGIGPPLLSVPGALIVGGVIITPFAGHYLYEWTALDVHTSEHFRVLYDAAAVTASTSVGGTNWSPAGAGAATTNSSFVQSLTDYGEEAWTAYAKAGFAMPSAPVTVKLDAWWFNNIPDPGMYDWRWNRIYLRTDKFSKKEKHRALKHRIAHELFHACQDAVLGLVRESSMKKFLAYLEGTAEYASCRLAWTLDDEMGHGNNALNPKLLEHPFNATGVQPGDGTEVEYDKGYWIDYFCKSGVTFTGLCAAVSMRADDDDPFRSGLDDCLRTSRLPSNLGDCYRRLAAFYLFSDEVPGRFGPRCSESEAEMEIPTPPEMLVTTDWSPALAEGLTAKVFMLRAPVDMEGKAKLQVKLNALSGGAVVDVFRFPDSKRVPCTPDVIAPWHIGALHKAGDVCPITAVANERIYVVAINTNATAAAQVGLQVSSVKLQIERVDPVIAATGQYVRVTGTGFGDDAKAGKVCFAGVEVPGTGVNSWQDEGVALIVPQQAVSGNLTVNVNGIISTPKWLDIADPLKVDFKMKYEENYLTEIVIAASGGREPYKCSWTFESEGSKVSGMGMIVKTKVYVSAQPAGTASDSIVDRPGPPALLTYSLVDSLCQTNTDMVNMGETPWPFE